MRTEGICNQSSISSRLSPGRAGGLIPTRRYPKSRRPALLSGPISILKTNRKLQHNRNRRPLYPRTWRASTMTTILSPLGSLYGQLLMLDFRVPMDDDAHGVYFARSLARHHPCIGLKVPRFFNSARIAFQLSSQGDIH